MSIGPAKEDRIIAGLDIGSSKIALLLGAVRSDGFDIVGLGVSSSQGVRNSSVVNIELTTESIKKAKEEAELMSGYTIQEVWLSVGGPHVQSFDSTGMIAVKNKEVSTEDVARVLETAKAINVPPDREVLHVLPREYKIDHQTGIVDPVGMAGVRLEASVHIMTANKLALQNLVKCAEGAGLRVKGFVLQQLASALAVLSEDEKKLGVCLIDVGAGTSDLICFTHGSVAYTSQVPVGGHHFTQDVSVGLRTPFGFAENLKKKFGCAISTLIDSDEMLEVEAVGGRKPRTMARQHLSEILEPRSEETLMLLKSKMDQSHFFPMLGSGVVLTGGASQLQGFAELAEFIFEVPVRVAAPERQTGLKDIVRNPAMSTVVGVALYIYELEKQKLTIKSSETSENLFSGMSRKIKDLFGGAL